MLEAPERRMSSCVITWMAEGLVNKLCGCLDTEVTSRFINSSRLNRFSSVGDGATSLVTAPKLALPITINSMSQRVAQCSQCFCPRWKGVAEPAPGAELLSIFREPGMSMPTLKARFQRRVGRAFVVAGIRHFGPKEMGR